MAPKVSLAGGDQSCSTGQAMTVLRSRRYGRGINSVLQGGPTCRVQLRSELGWGGGGSPASLLFPGTCVMLGRGSVLQKKLLGAQGFPDAGCGAPACDRRRQGLRSGGVC